MHLIFEQTCQGKGSPCTTETTYAVGQWLGQGSVFTVVDTPGFQDSEQAKYIISTFDILKCNITYIDIFF